MTAWLAQHGKALIWAITRLAGAPMTTLLSLLAIGVALALPTGGQMLIANAQRLASRHATPQISVFLSLDATSGQVDAVAARLKAAAGIKTARFVPRRQTLERFKHRQGLTDVIAALPANPFPDAFIVTPRDPTPQAMEALRNEIAGWPQIAHVQLDSAWVRQVDALLHLARTGVVFLAALLGLGLVAVTFTTIRLQVLTRRAEIEVSRLLGATDAFIRRPFYYFGSLQGLLGGAVAWLIVLLATLALRGPIANLATLYHANAVLQTLDGRDSLLLLAFAAGLGWLGAALSLARHLRAAA